MEKFVGYSRLIHRFHLVLGGGGEKGDFLSEGIMGLQTDVTEASQNPIQARTLDCLLLNPIELYESGNLCGINHKKGFYR